LQPHGKTAEPRAVRAASGSGAASASAIAAADHVIESGSRKYEMDRWLIAIIVTFYECIFKLFTFEKQFYVCFSFCLFTWKM